MAKKKIEQNDPKGQILKSHLPNMLTGVHYQLSIYQPSIIVDCHMHIQSANCATLPFLWARTGPLRSRRMKRVTIQTIGSAGESVWDALHVFVKSAHTSENMAATADQKELYRTHKFRTALDVAKNNTYKIGQRFIEKKYADVFDNYFSKEGIYTNAPHLMFLCIVMPMDMEYAHLDGYYGLKVCNAIYESPEDIANDKDPIAYWTPMKRSKDKTFGGKAYQERMDDRRVLTEEQTKSQFDAEKADLEKQGVPGAYYDAEGRIHKVNVKSDIVLLDGEAGVMEKLSEKPDPKTDTARYEQWKKQMQHTELAMLAHPLKLLPLFHYDPRRWQIQDAKNAKAFEQVGGSGLYLGFKIYTAQGYRPWDVKRLPVLKDFYARCVTGRIPVLNHCTPGGAPAFDREAYLDFEHPRDNAEDEKSKYCKELTTPAMKDSFGTATGRAGSGSFKKAPVKKTAKQFFIDEFVSPGAWKKVLQEYPSLRLCLAHFGGAEDMKAPNTPLEQTWCGQIVEMIKSGDYPYLYADLSSSFANPIFRRYFQDKVYPDPDFQMKIRKRILFGSDWYLTLLDGKEYREFCETAKNFLDNLDSSLWIRFTQVNPYRFYRLDEQIERIAGNIVEKRQNDEEVLKFFGKKKVTQEKIDLINKEAAYIKIANKFFVNYEES